MVKLVVAYICTEQRWLTRAVTAQPNETSNIRDIRPRRVNKPGVYDDDDGD